MSVELVDQVDGKDLYAKRAEQDENGLNIDQYYAKKSEIPEVPVQDVKVNGSSVVDEHGVANVNVPEQQQSDWNQSNSSAVDYIKNKPQNLVQDASYVHTDNNFTNNDKNKLDGIEAGAEANVQADWSEDDSSADDYIKNKPDLSIYAEKSDLATVATTGDYDDLQHKPAIPAAQVQSDYGQTDTSAVDYIKNKPDLSVYAEKSELAAVATSGDYDDLQHKPSIPAAQVQSDWAQSDSSAVDYIKNKPQNLVQDASYVHTDNNFTNNDKNKLDGIEAGAEVNVQSDWNQSDSNADDYIKNKPTIPVVPTLVEGANITITQNGNTITIANKMTAGDGIDIDANGVISVDADDLNIDYWHGGSSVALASGSNLNANLSATSYRGSNIYASSGAITLKKGTYGVHAFVKLSNSGVSANANLYKISVNGGITGGTPVKTIEFDNSFAHEEVYELSFMTFNTSDTDAALVLTCDALTQLAGIACTLSYIQVYCLNGLVGQSGGSGGGTANVALTSSDNSVAINETTIGDTSTFDLSVKAVPAVSSVDDGKILKASYSGGVGSYTWETPPVIPTQQQSDWAQSNTSAVDYIRNKPITKTLIEGSGVHITETLNGVTISADAVPAVTSADDGKILKATYSGGVGTYSWETAPATGVTDVTVDGVSVVTQGVAAITMPTDLVPAVTSSDDGKILKATYSGGTGSYSWDTAPSFTQQQSDWTQPNSGSVDYIKNKPSVLTLVQGNGMTFTEDSVNNTLTIINAAPVPTVGSGDNGKVLKASYSGGTASYSWETESGGGGAQVQSNWTETNTASAAYIQNKPATKSLVEGTGIHISETSNSVTISADAVPTVTSNDNGKILKATYSGGTGSYSWETAPSVPSSLGDLTITAGITDIQVVSALPAQPVATVLYLIPET